MRNANDIFEAFLNASGINRNYDLSVLSGNSIVSNSKEYHVGLRRSGGLLTYDMVLLSEFVKNFSREEGLQIDYLAAGKVQAIKDGNKILEVALEESSAIKIICFDKEVFDSLLFKMEMDTSCMLEKVGASFIEFYIALLKKHEDNPTYRKVEANKIIGLFQKVSKYMEDHKQERQPVYETNPDIIEASRFITFLLKVLEKDKGEEGVTNFMLNSAANSQDMNHQALTRAFHYLISYIDSREPEVSNENNLTWAQKEQQRIEARAANTGKQPDYSFS